MNFNSTLVIILSLFVSQFSYAASCLQSISYSGSCSTGKSTAGSAICLDGVSKTKSYNNKCTAQTTIKTALETACANDCFVKVCEPNSTNNACSGSNGSGVRTCNANGSGFVGSCNINQCNSGYNLQLVSGVNTCVANVCTPNSTNNACTGANGSGVRTCNSTGSGFTSSCDLTQCDSGYHVSHSGFPGLIGHCELNVCNPDPSQSTPLACASAPENSATSHRFCNSDGSAFSSCTIDSCLAGLNLQYVNGVLACIAGYQYDFKYDAANITPSGPVTNVDFSAHYWNLMECGQAVDDHVMSLDSSNSLNASFLAAPGIGWRAVSVNCPIQRAEPVYDYNALGILNIIYSYPNGCVVNSNISTTPLPQTQPPNYLCP